MFEVPNLPVWAPGEEYANTLTHFVGAVMTFVAIFFLVNTSRKSCDKLKMIGNCLFIGSLLTMFCFSTIYHALEPCYLKRIFRLLDHISIFLLIAGSYTPFATNCLVKTTQNAIAYLVLVWCIATFGIMMKILFFEAFEAISLYVYVGMGWIMVFNLKALSACMSSKGIVCLMLSGVSYTSGVYFYQKSTPYFHAIWHAFVMLGAFWHFICICCYT